MITIKCKSPPDLNKGITLAIFILSGNVAVSNDKLHIYKKGCNIELNVDLIINILILSQSDDSLLLHDLS